ncbi:MAG: GGDEF domain-containing protein [Lachnospiraceae bacterium]|nr:GGDEF domain-containing protein [Lachnospiraceae bacterium]
MSNIRHYIHELMHGNSFFSVKLICRYTVVSIGVIHMLNMVLFLIAESFVMAGASLAGGVMYFTLILRLVKKDRLLTMYLISFAEILTAVLLCTLLIGWDAGFSAYLYASVSSSFYFTFVGQKNQEHPHQSLPLVLSLMVIFAYFLNYAIMLFITPLLPIAEAAMMTVIYIYNTLVAFALMIVFSYLFVWEILNRQRVLAEQNEKLDELAHKDPLTHLLNRRSMNEMLTERMEILKRTGRRFTMILGDIDDFKKVNDTFGHEAGDKVLVTVAEILHSCVGEEDAVCRWGGEEILILIASPLELGAVTAEHICRKIESSVIKYEEKEIHITMTFGIAESIPGYRVEHLIQQADDKLYYGKTHGKNQVVSDIPKPGDFS